MVTVRSNCIRGHTVQPWMRLRVSFRYSIGRLSLRPTSLPWHGFRRIALPPDKQQLSRKSFSIYLYTKDRPAEEVLAPHTTFYLPQPLPANLRVGHTLTEQDMLELHIRTQGRDGLLAMYQKLLIEKEQRLRDLMKLNQGDMSMYLGVIS